MVNYQRRIEKARAKVVNQEEDVKKIEDIVENLSRSKDVNSFSLL